MQKTAVQQEQAAVQNSEVTQAVVQHGEVAEAPGPETLGKLDVMGWVQSGLKQTSTQQQLAASPPRSGGDATGDLKQQQAAVQQTKTNETPLQHSHVQRQVTAPMSSATSCLAQHAGTSAPSAETKQVIKGAADAMSTIGRAIERIGRMEVC